MNRGRLSLVCVSMLGLGLLPWVACRQMVDQTDRRVATIIAERQQQALGQQAAAPVPVEDDLFDRPPSTVYTRQPSPLSAEVPDGFEGQRSTSSASDATSVPDVTDVPDNSDGVGAPRDNAATQPTTSAAIDADQAPRFTLTDALAYAQGRRRALQAAQEDLYLVALSLTLERHLWTPVFASNLRTVYGNFGEITDFDQAMRFVADLSVSQRLPYGGEFTARAVSTLIRDVKKTITASEGSSIELELSVPFLRNAGHVAREDLIQLERELTYAVREFERFRRRQLVDVATAYFNLLRDKQTVLDTEKSLERVALIYEKARQFEIRELGSLLETQTAEQSYLFAENRTDIARESFRAQADQFKLTIGMPVDEQLNMEDLVSIDSIETEIANGMFPLLLLPPAADQEERALQVAAESRLDLKTQEDRIDDARRGIAVAKNSLLPDLDLISTVTWETDPEHYRLGDFSFERTTWRSELILGLPLERTRERNRYRSALIDVRRAQRNYEDALERIRAEVRSAVNQIRLQTRSVQIQERNLLVADNRVEFARIQYDDGDIDVQRLLDAENDWTSTKADLNEARTALWRALLRFRLTTETLRVDEDGVQHGAAEFGEQ
ncbi:MAG: TolC family protein [Planctomycetota bacterium]